MKDLILVIGSEGLVGSRYLEISELKTAFHAPRQVELDLTKPSELKAVLSSFEFTAVVNFAAYTDVNKAEEERNNQDGDCWQINVEGVRNLVGAVKPLRERIQFVQISTNNVFPGSKDDPGPYLENHPLDHSQDQLGWYGYTKAVGEKIVMEELGQFATVVRLLYPVRSNFGGKLDYVRKILSLYDENKLYPLFSDQQTNITFIDETVKALDIVIKNKLHGTFHTASNDLTTPYDLASYLLEKVRGVTNAVRGVKLEDFLREVGQAEYRYPRYGGLSVAMTEHKLGMKFSSWRQIIDILVKQGLGKIE